jgi:hypothetical protein
VLFASVAETVALVGTHKENMSNINAVDRTPLRLKASCSALRERWTEPPSSVFLRKVEAFQTGG